jgi:ComF family protein
MEELSLLFQKIIREFFQIHSAYIFGVDHIVAVPLASRRYAERGFNQSDAIAKIIAEIGDMPIGRFVERVRETKHQARLTRKERFHNIHEAFVVKGAVPENVLLVDDVFTTGATMQECAKVLKNAGTRRVIGLSMGRG